MRRFALAAVLLLTSCTPQPPAISQISDSSVTVIQHMLTKPEAVVQEAQRGCGLYKKQATLLSRNCLDEYCYEKSYLFACTEAGQQPVTAAP